jgi:hypothetical protein
MSNETQTNIELILDEHGFVLYSKADVRQVFDGHDVALYYKLWQNGKCSFDELSCKVVAAAKLVLPQYPELSAALAEA